MNFTKEQFEKAFAEFQAFGPRRRVPIEERWREVLPDIDPSEFASLQAQCQEIESYALGLAEQVREKQITSETGMQQLGQKHPFLTPERLGHTWSQAVYFSLK